MIPLPVQAAMKNRARLQSQLRGKVVFLEGGKPIQRNKDVHYPFRQSSTYTFLTGVHLSDTACLITSKKCILFIPNQDSRHAIWLGKPLTLIQAKKQFHFDEVYFTDAIPRIFRSLLRKGALCLAPQSSHRQVRKWMRGVSLESKALEQLITRLRLVKTNPEIRCLQKAAEISDEAHKNTAKAIRPGMKEYQVQSYFEQSLLWQGLTHTAYPSIVASGINSAVLHYHENSATLRRGDLLLIDAAGEYGGYAADITRTFPVSGRFNARQKQIYSLVLSAQKSCIQAIRPGTSVQKLQDLTIRLLCEGLKDMGILRGKIDTLIEKKTYALFYPHGVSHTLGLDVHDVTPPKSSNRTPGLRTDMTLASGNVITVEPGIYFIRVLLSDREKRKIHKQEVDWAKVSDYMDFGGIRIEDDVLVNSQGHQVLSHVPKEIDAVESLMQSS